MSVIKRQGVTSREERARVDERSADVDMVEQRAVCLDEAGNLEYRGGFLDHVGNLGGADGRGAEGAAALLLLLGVMARFDESRPGRTSP